MRRAARALTLGSLLVASSAGCSTDTGLTLFVEKHGSAPGTVTSDPAGIDCGSTCKAGFPKDSLVRLTATPGSSAVFTGWSGVCSGTGACEVTIAESNKTAIATFARASSLTVTKEGSGAVVSMPEAIDCGPTCTAMLADKTNVTLAAIPDPGWAFAGWSGDCSGAALCRITITKATNVKATFTTLETLTITKDGMGTVASAPAGIDCGSGCTASFPKGTSVRLTATPAPSWVFTGWSGACTGTEPCVVSVDGAKTVGARFAPTFAVMVTKTGMGTVVSSPQGIDCGSTCSASFASGTMVTLTATAPAGWLLSEWTGACTGNGTCVLTGEATVNATFVASTSVTVRKAGAGMGTVTSSPAGISCGTTCGVSLPKGTKLTLTAMATDGSAFVGWSGACTGTGACEVTADLATNVTATFEPLETLTVVKSGTGGGTITSMPAGIACGATCQAIYGRGTQVTLTAMPAAGSVFSGWSGACTGADKCVVTLDAAKTATAAFVPAAALTVSKQGTGMGQVVSMPKGIDCGTSCSATFAAGTTVTLVAIPAMGSVFTAWSGACTTAGACVVTLDAAKSVTATFQASYELTVTKAGPGMGTVTSMPAGIDCGAMCAATFAGGTSVTLQATPGAGWVFAGWSGPCTGTEACTFTINAATQVTATFARNYTLTITKYGSGTVSSVPAGIDCGAACSAPFTGGTNVTLTATPAATFVFAGWSGPCTGVEPCTITMDNMKALTATFIPDVAFGTASAKAAGAGPRSLALGHLDNDGKLDLAVSNFGANSVSILLGDGAGGFVAPADITVGPAPLGIVISSFDASSAPDLAVVSSTGNSVSLLLGDNTGAFTPSTSPGAGSSPIAIAAGDLNKDNKGDLVVVATSGSANVTVLLGNNTGTFPPGTGFAAGNTPQSVAIADINKDAKLDLVVANLGSHDISILLGRGDGTFQTATSTGAGMSPRSVAVADVNLDGKLDAVVADSSGGGISTLLGNGNGTFQAATTSVTGSGARAVAVTDFNGDGRPDVVVANETAGTVSLLLGSGTPALFIAPRHLGVSAQPTSVVAGDLNGDGKSDIVVGHGAGTSVSVLLQL